MIEKIKKVEEDAQEILDKVHKLCISEEYCLKDKNEALSFIIETIQKQQVNLNRIIEQNLKQKNG